jgi:hypothetical protein
MRPLPWAPRPFRDEAFGSWIGRLAGRYRMSVVLLNADFDLQLRFDGPLHWLFPSTAGAESMARLSGLTRLGEVHIPPPAPYDSDKPSRSAPYCRRCVFLNPEEVESPYWHRVWLAPGAAYCEIHRLPLATLKGELVRRSHNLPHLLKRVGRQELERRELAGDEG